MPETRYVEEFKDGELVNSIPYQMSDDDLELEAREKKIQELLDIEKRSTEEDSQLIDLLADRNGFSLPKTKKVKKVTVVEI